MHLLGGRNHGGAFIGSCLTHACLRRRRRVGLERTSGSWRLRLPQQESSHENMGTSTAGDGEHGGEARLEGGVCPKRQFGAKKQAPGELDQNLGVT